MRQKGYTDFELFDAGLVRRGKNGGFYDTFRNRLMFPVIDVRGNVIGFSGRILGDGEPKYLNSPETLVFNKSRNLFALNLAKKSKSGYIILSEGNIDVVSLHQAGFDSAVASLGTSLTPEQARLISRYTNEVIIAYDNDGAGLKASQRAIEILEKLDIKVRVLRMTGAKDPDEYIKTKGPEAFRKLLEGSENQMDYRLRAIREKYDLNVTEQKSDYLREAVELLARLPDEVRRQVYAMDLAKELGLPPDVIVNDVERRRKRLVSTTYRQVQKEQARPEKQMQPAARELKYDDPASAAAEEAGSTVSGADFFAQPVSRLRHMLMASSRASNLYIDFIETSVLAIQLDWQRLFQRSAPGENTCTGHYIRMRGELQPQNSTFPRK
jgi:DNA primase